MKPMIPEERQLYSSAGKVMGYMGKYYQTLILTLSLNLIGTKKIYTNPVVRASSGDQSGAWVNHRILRYADVLLMAAEAANESGDLPTAKKWVDTIRYRARTSAGGNETYLPPVTASTQAAMRTAIQQERHVEFAMEGERFFDLVRWGLADSVLGTLGYTSKNKYYPLPQGVIDASSGVLIQNPDY
eukprot:TRINITY_DN70383_c0_g1_i1.p1 TRINITY_DN70383_c0_g1~~TRINITY_DN70383_c0_g1_i1.p1  ORF type:complete len:186 (-),score=7.40 TRINITY_DN70383_c0_g1_i1:39-596(-)